MTMAVSVPPARQRGGLFGWIVFAVVAATVFGKLPNPLDRFFEIGPGMYHTLDAVLATSKSPRLALVLKDVLDRDGKLTLANMSAVWGPYEDAIPASFSIPVEGAGDRAAERARLIDLVHAHPQRSVPTITSDTARDK